MQVSNNKERRQQLSWMLGLVFDLGLKLKFEALALALVVPALALGLRL